MHYEGKVWRLREERCLPAGGDGALDGHLAVVAAGAAILDVFAGVGLAAVPDIVVAVSPSGNAHGGLALAAAALCDGVGDLLAAVAARAAVVGVAAGAGLAAVPDVVVAVGVSGDAHGGLALAVAALGDGVGDLFAAVAALAAVLHVLADVRLAPIAPQVVVAVGPPRGAGVNAFAILALDGGVGQPLTLLAAVAAVVHVILDARLAPGLWGLQPLNPDGQVFHASALPVTLHTRTYTTSAIAEDQSTHQAHTHTVLQS